MKNQYKFRSLLVFAFAIAAYGIHAGTSHVPVEKSAGELPVLTMEETITDAPKLTAKKPAPKTENPAEELFERFGKSSPSNSPHFIEHMGVRIDLTEIDLLVETEIAAGTIKSRKDIHSFRLKAIDKKALQMRDGVAYQPRRQRRPTSTR